MKSFKAIVAIIGMALCVSACPKPQADNTAEDNAMMNAAAPEAAMPEANAAIENNMAMPENGVDNGERTDTGPRGNPGG